MKILLIDDDQDIHKLVKKAINPLVTLEAVSSFPSNITEFEKYDLILLDLMLKEGSSLKMLEELDEDEATFFDRIILLTASNDDDIEVEFHKFGVLDYIKKPFNPKILSAKIDKHLSQKKKSNTELKYGPFFLDLNNHVVTVEENQKIELTMKEFKILRKLVEAKGRTITKEQMITDIWSMNEDTQTRTVDMHVSSLRKKLGKYGDLIKTRRGLGYSVEI